MKKPPLPLRGPECVCVCAHSCQAVFLPLHPQLGPGRSWEQRASLSLLGPRSNLGPFCFCWPWFLPPVVGSGSWH